MFLRPEELILQRLHIGVLRLDRALRLAALSYRTKVLKGDYAQGRAEPIVSNWLDDHRDRAAVAIDLDVHSLVHHCLPGREGLLHGASHYRTQGLPQDPEQAQRRHTGRGLEIAAGLPTRETNNFILAVDHQISRGMPFKDVAGTLLD